MSVYVHVHLGMQQEAPRARSTAGRMSRYVPQTSIVLGAATASRTTLFCGATASQQEMMLPDLGKEGRSTYAYMFIGSLLLVNFVLIYSVVNVNVAHNICLQDLYSERREIRDLKETQVIRERTSKMELLHCSERENRIMQAALVAKEDDERGWLTAIMAAPRDFALGDRLVTVVDGITNTMPTDVFEPPTEVAPGAAPAGGVAGADAIEGGPIALQGAMATVLRGRFFWFGDNEKVAVQLAESRAQDAAPDGVFEFDRITSVTEEQPKPLTPPLRGFENVPEPTAEERQYVRDVVASLNAMAGKCTYGLLLHPSVRPCPNAFELIAYAVSKTVRASPDWTSISFTKGALGMVFRCNEIPRLTKFLEAHQWTASLSTLVHTYFHHKPEEGGRFDGGKGAMFYRFDLFAESIADCYSNIRHANDGYNAEACSKTDISPCDNQIEAGIMLVPQHGTTWEAAPAANVKKFKKRKGIKSAKKEVKKAAVAAAAAAKPAAAAAAGAKAKGAVGGSTGVAKTTVVIANKGQSCNTACSKEELFCDDIAIKKINNCKTMAKLFPQCENKCESNEGEDQPALDTVADLCLIKTRENFSCFGSHAKTKRACVCSTDATLKSKFGWERALENK